MSIANCDVKLFPVFKGVLSGQPCGGTSVANIVANYVGYTGVSGAHVGLLEANGAANTGLTIEDTTIYNVDAYGGFAVNQSGGSATANANIVTIHDSDFLANSSGSGNGLRGGYAESTMTTSGQSINLEASNNVINIANTSNDKNRVQKQFVGDITGGRAQLNSGASITNFSGAVLTANNNAVTIGDGVTVSLGNIYGAYIGTQNVASGGATITASNNTVIVNGDFTGNNGQGGTNVIAGAIAESGISTLTNNHVTINGKVTNTSYIYGASASQQVTLSGTLDNPQHTLNNNSITIGADADVTGAQIWAAASASTNALTFNNDVTIEGTVKNSDIFGGTGADSAITLAAGGTLAYNSATADSKNELRSDVVNLNGTVNIGANDTLTISGFVHNGDQNATSYNTNETNIASSATLYNRNTLELLGDTTVANGAKLHALTAGAKIEVNGDVSGSTIDDTLDPKTDIDFEMVGGRGSLTISAADLKSYLTSGDSYTLGTTTSTDKAGTVALKSGGVLNFSDPSVVISDFDYSTTDTAGAIKVESDATKGGSVIKGNELTIAHKFATNATTAEKYEDLRKLTPTAGILIEANTLNLGAADLSSDRSAAITFGQATVKEEINFIARTSGKDISDDDGKGHWLKLHAHQ